MLGALFPRTIHRYDPFLHPNALSEPSALTSKKYMVAASRFEHASMNEDDAP